MSVDLRARCALFFVAALLLVARASGCGLQVPKRGQGSLVELRGGASAGTPLAQAVTGEATDESLPPSSSFSVHSRKPSLFNWGRLRFVEHGFRRALSLLIRDPDVLRLVAKALHWTFWFTAILCAAGTAGLDTKPILSLLSVSLVTVGFAAKDVLNSLFAGILLVVQRPFRRGDTIALLGHKGIVMDISMKYVRLRCGRSDALLPVALVINAPIVIESVAVVSYKK